MWETQVRSLGWEDPLAKGRGYPLQYSCLKNPMDRGAWWAIQSMGSQRVRHDWVNNTHSKNTITETRRANHFLGPCLSPPWGSNARSAPSSLGTVGKTSNLVQLFKQKKRSLVKIWCSLLKDFWKGGKCLIWFKKDRKEEFLGQKPTKSTETVHGLYWFFSGVKISVEIPALLNFSRKLTSRVSGLHRLSEQGESNPATHLTCLTGLASAWMAYSWVRKHLCCQVCISFCS